MRTILCVLALCLLTGCEEAPEQCPDGKCPSTCPDGKCPVKTVTWAEVPIEIRQGNYARSGSCAWAAMETLFRYHGRDDLAAEWRQSHSGGAFLSDTVAACESDKLTYAYTNNGDRTFLDWCSATRRVAMIHWMDGNHAINFCGWKDGKALLIDNNSPARTIEMRTDQFLAEWRRANGGVALAIADPPPPREPWL